MNVKRFHRSARYAQQFIAEHGPLHPMTIGFNDEKGFEICLVTPWADDDEKRRALTLITLTFALHGVNEYHFMTEAWMATRFDADAHRPGRQLRVSEMKEKREVLLVVGASYDDPAGLGMVMELVRDETGRLIEFGEPLMNDLSHQGMMLELLPPVDFIMPEEYKPLVSRFLDQFIWKPDFIEIEGEH